MVQAKSVFPFSLRWSFVIIWVLSVSLFSVHLVFTCPPAETVADTDKIILTPEQALQIRSIGDLQLSTDNRYIAMTVTEPVKGESRDSDIWIYDTVSRQLQKFTNSDKADRHPRWSPDCRTLAFISSRKEKPQIYTISLKGGEAQALTDCKTGVQSFEWAPEGKRIAYLAPEPKTEEEEKKQKDKDDTRVVDIDDKPPRLWSIDAASKQVKQLTQGPWRVADYCWTPDGRRLIVTATDRNHPELLTERLYALEVEEGKLTEIARPALPFGLVQVSPDGKRIAYMGTRTDGPTANDLFIMPLEGGKARNLTQNSIGRSAYFYVWHGNNHLIYQAATGFAVTFYEIDLEGRAKKLPSYRVHPSGSFVIGPDITAFVGQTSTQLPELWISETPGEAKKASAFNAEWDDVVLIPPEIVTYPSFDGTKIEAALLKPRNYRQGTPVPLIVLVHGGPAGVWSDRFEPWGQLLAQRGFAVLYPNIRGSIGYGQDFVRANRRDWGGGDFKDVMAGVDFMIEQGIADPERLGIGGWSYGGYMAAWAVTQTDRFKAAVSGAPMTDLASEYGTEEAGINAYDTWYMGSPYEGLELFQERSPVTHVKNVKTPTLLLTGENDRIDPIGQCQQFYRGLKRYGVETEYVVYPREGHGIQEEKLRIDLMKRILAWFERYVK